MRLMIAAGLLLAAATPLSARDAEPDFSPDRVRADVEFLADDLLEGRDAGTRGYDLAALYVASRFEGLGLIPGGTRGWYQPIGFARARLRDGAPATLTVGGKVFANGGDVAMLGNARELDQMIEAGAVFVGYGLDAPGHGYDDYSGLDVRGKVAVMLSGLPERGTPSEIAAHLSGQKIKMAERRGAIATITIPTRAALAKTPWSRVQGYAKMSRYVWIGPDGKPWSSAPGARIGAQVNGAAAEALFAGSRASLKTVLDAASKKGAMPRGFALKPAVRLERHSVAERMDSSNVIGLIPGSDPVLKHEVVLLTAHLDHDGIDSKREGDKLYNGAMDNAAGIATMLEVARAFTEVGKRPKRTVVFAAVTAEEDGLLGSQYLAKHAPMPKGDRLVGVVNLDMPVLTYDFTDVIAFGGEHSTLGPIADRALASAGVKVSPDPMPEEGVFTRSDHYSFVVEGVPSIMLATGFAGEGRDKFMSFLKNRYHKPSDDLSQDFDWKAGAKFARINYLIAREIADAAEAPRWYAGNFFGETFAKGAPKAPAPAASKPKGK
ncbi:M20/M25/M40 family metallo-hydrolase [Sphingomonas sp. MG17]|uniref:M20/M25/M40 family metallo-hydrolase n=1 Tax=Sphingomonas tagetis TaxID=2949092 RepID=A0A9X2HF17_9SPHN|nr:M20/M25/M40 family metallo-hydrolase [Sphingomonas tagetis]MCP3729668.1 M20/M25/M40 family metallo-hydrolase [Sphingomonas tagetis]